MGGIGIGRQAIDDAITLTTYCALESFVAAFAAGHINLLILVGEPGLAKGTTVRQMLDDDICWIQGNATPFGIYLKLYEYRDKMIVIDDVDSLYSNRHAVRLLKCLCQTESEKLLAWPTAARQLKQEQVPREFVTTSRVVIISNDWTTQNRNVAAVQDRGHTIRFAPTAHEVHWRTGLWFDDQEVYQWIGERLDQVVAPTMRLYYRARELKSAGLDWKNLVFSDSPMPRRRLVAELLADRSFDTQEARAREFTVRGGGCRATFFNHLRSLRQQQGV